MTVVVPHLTHGGGGGWNSSGMMSGSLAFRRERDWSLGHRRLSSDLIAVIARTWGAAENQQVGAAKGQAAHNQFFGCELFCSDSGPTKAQAT